jgi:hypothetical protein
MTIHTSKRILTLKQLIKGNAPETSLFTGRFEQSILATKDYEVTVITHIDYADADGDKGECSNETFYEFYSVADDNSRKLDSPEAVKACIDHYMSTISDMVKVQGAWADMDENSFQKTKRLTSEKAFFKVTFEQDDLVITQVNALSPLTFEGFIKKQDSGKLTDIEGVQLSPSV